MALSIYKNSSMSIPKASLLLLLVCAASAALNCGPGAVLCPSGTCQYPTYIEGCAQYASATVCAKCEFNYLLTGNTCVYSPASNPTSCCLSYSASGDCQQCADGLLLVNGLCKESKIVGCLEKAVDGSCANCAAEYQLVGGVCLKKVAGCSSYLNNGACQACATGFSLNSGFCVPSITINQTLPGCQVVFDFGCAECQTGYKLLPDGTCQSGLLEGCERYTQSGSCQVCRPPLYTLYNGQCITYGCAKLNENGKCVQCDSSKGFTLSNDGFCQLANCLVSNQDTCLICQSGYIESAQGCVPSTPVSQCTICPRNTFLSSTGECITLQPGCLEYQGSRCVKCESEYYLSPLNDCETKQPGCVYNNGACASCAAPFQMVNGKCVIEGCSALVMDGCKTCVAPYILSQRGFCTYPNCNQVSNGKCLSCCDGFAANRDGFCYPVDPLCKTYDMAGKCIECVLGHYLDSSNSIAVCKEEVFGCNYVDRKCVSCRAPFTFNSTSQTCYIDGCLNYFLGGCQKCDAGYDLRYNFCKLPNCLVSVKSHCSQCDPDYVLRSDGLCVNKDEFCWKYDDKGFCSECATNYYMSALSKKCKPREPGCQYDNNDKCVSCDKPFYFDGVRCEIYGCLELNAQGCNKCYYPMQVTSDKLCAVVNCDRMQEDKCVACKPGFQIANDGSCQAEDSKCLVYCNTGCEKCTKGYRVDQNGRCQYADEHCWDFSAQGHCTNCDRLYFLNQFNKCEIKDNNCAAYSGGKCAECKNYFYLFSGLCYPNAKGCINQVDIKTCAKCEDGYKLTSGVCTQKVEALNWNSIDMDFGFGSTAAETDVAQSVFTVGKTNLYNLDGALVKGNAKPIYSSILTGRNCFQVDDNSDSNGWSPSGSGQQWLGVLLERTQTFYALDIKYLQGTTLTKFAIEAALDGVNYVKIAELSPKQLLIGSVETFYFTPFEAKAIRLVVLGGSVNIKIEFYYSNGQNQYPTSTSTSTTWIQQQTEITVQDSYKGQVFSTSSSCSDKALCWMGIELCQVGAVRGFAITPKSGSQGAITAVTVKYSQDGVNFYCYNNCSEFGLSGAGSYQFSPAVTATKVRVYPAKWTGQPEYTVTFDY